MITVHIQVLLISIGVDTIGNPTLLGIGTHMIVVVIHLPIAKGALVTIIVKDRRDITPRTVLPIDHLGDHYIQDLHI